MAVLPTDTAAGDIAASDDSATQNPRLGPLTFDAQGRVNNQDIESGTNPPVITTIESQSVNANAFGPQYGTSYGEEGRPPEPGGDPGTPTNDDAGTRTNTKQIINNSFGTRIQPQNNVLDQYASYTYSISWYILKPEAYKSMIQTHKRLLAGAQLLVQSGGASTATTSQSTETVPGVFAADGGPVTSSSTRAPLFNVDYYFDNLEIVSNLPGGKTRMAHNATELKFNITEPNGLTLVPNLVRTVESVYANSKIPYSAATYMLVIKFYGYDDQGNLINAGKNKNSSTDSRAVIEKFYPFKISNLKFRMANRAIVYDISGTCVPYTIGLGENLGIIKAPMALTGTTVKDVLSGSTVTATTNNDPSIVGREDTANAPEPIGDQEGDYPLNPGDDAVIGDQPGDYDQYPSSTFDIEDI